MGPQSHTINKVDVTVKHPGFARHLFLLSTAARASQGMGSYAQMIRIGECEKCYHSLLGTVTLVTSLSRISLSVEGFPPSSSFVQHSCGVKRSSFIRSSTTSGMADSDSFRVGRHRTQREGKQERVSATPLHKRVVLCLATQACWRAERTLQTECGKETLLHVM